MKSINRVGTAIVIVLCWSFIAEQSLAGCRAVVRHNNVVIVEKVVKEVVAAVVTPAVAVFQAVAVPVYTYNAQYYPSPVAPAFAPGYAGGGYAGGGVQPNAVTPCDQTAAKLDKVLTYLQSLDERVNKLEGGTGSVFNAKPPQKTTPNPMQRADEQSQNAPANLLNIVSSKCASCHDSSRGAVKGGFTLMKGGQLSELSSEQLGNIIDRITTEDTKRQMPPPAAPQCTPQEKLKVVSLLVNGK